MEKEFTSLSESELQAQRERIRHGLWRAQLAGAGVLLFTFVLVVLAGWLAQQSYRQATVIARTSATIESERSRAEEALGRFRLEQARSARHSGKYGGREESLQAIAEAARVRPSRELRDEAIASLSVVGLGEEESFCPLLPNTPGNDQQDPFRLSVDPTLRYLTRIMPDGSVRCVTFKGGKPVCQIPGIGEAVNNPVVWSADGEYLAVCYTNRMRVYELKTQRMMLETEGSRPAAIHAPIAISPDHRLVFAWVQGEGLIFEMVSGRVLQRLPACPVLRHAAFHPRRPVVSLLGVDDMLLWEFETSLPPTKVDRHGYTSPYLHHAWRDDGRALAAGCEDGTVMVWDVSTLKNKQVRYHGLVGHEQPCFNVAFNHAGDKLVSCSRGANTAVWFPFHWGGEEIARMSRGYGVQFSQDDQHLVCLRPNEGASLRSVTGGEVAHRVAGPIGYSAKFVDITFSPDGRWLAGVNGDGLFLWDLKINWIIARGVTPNPQSVHILPDGLEIITTGMGGVVRWPGAVMATADGSLQYRTSGQPIVLPLPEGAKPGRSCLSLDGTKLFVSIGSGKAALLNLTKTEAPILFSGSGEMESMAFSPDGRQVATGSSHGAGTCVWDAATGLPLQKLGGLAAEVTYSADGEWLVMSKAAEHALWRTSDKTVAKIFPREAGESSLGAFAFLPGTRTAMLTKSGAQLDLVDAGTLEVLTTILSAKKQTIEALRVSADGRWLAVVAGTVAGNILLYDLPLLQRELERLNLPWPGRGPALRPGDTSSESSHTGLSAISPSQAAGQTASSALARSRRIWLLVALALLFAAALGALVHRYYRQLLASYFELDTLVARRNQELALAQSEIVNAQKMKALGTLAAGIAHDFNNLLSVIRMSSTLIRRDAKNDSEIQENVSEIEEAVQQGKKVVRSMLGYSSAANEKQSVFSLLDLAEDTVALLSKQFLSGITLNLELDRDVPMLRGSRGSLEQILLNLIVNASESMQGKGALRIAVRGTRSAEGANVRRPSPASEYVELVVADSGPGIAPDILPRIFEPFFTTKSVGSNRGTGLGLSMVYTIAEQSAFGIGVQSVPGKGAEFRIVIPVEVKSEAVNPPSLAGAVSPK